MIDKQKELLLEICKCEEFEKAKLKESRTCNKIVESQEGKIQFPEPWSGHIDKAEILFISSNPSFDENENYPTANWSDEEVVDFFENRFDLKGKPYSSVKKKKGGWSSYWRSINKWVGWVIKKDGKNENLLNEHAALTEIVHCKSTKEKGVCKCMGFCTQQWLSKILNNFKGEIIIVVGTKAKEMFDKVLVNDKKFDKALVNDKKIAYAAHPNRREKGLTDIIREKDMMKQLNSKS